MAALQQTVSELVVEAVSEESGRDTLDLPPLYETIDPDALDRVVGGLRTGAVSFQYAGYDVTVRADGSIDASPSPTFTGQSTGNLADD